VIDTWIQSLPEIETRLQTAIREAREVIADLDDTPPSTMDQMFYMHGYEVLRIQLEELLSALPSTTEADY
jgi:hypothetical protein